MQFITDLKSIRSGVRKAKEDYKAIKAHEAEHDRRHVEDPSWRCGPFLRDFFEGLRAHVNPHRDPLEAAAYLRTSERIGRRVLGKKEFERRMNPPAMPTPQDILKSLGINVVDFVNVETDGDESPEEVFERARRAFAEKDQFEQVVSETGIEDQSGDNR